jgi:hypothetical protein
LGKELKTPHRKIWAFYETDTCASGLEGSFGMTFEKKTRGKEATWQTQA